MRLATRGSALALTQARLVARGLEAAAPGLRVELVTIRTAGDVHSPGEPGDKSRWVREIERALLVGDADLAVHSAKDVPGELPAELAIVGVPERADARDALCGARSLDALATGAHVGTSSLRRRSQLLAARPDLHVEELRGNVDTRLRRLDEGRYEAVVLAQAGLVRLGRMEGTPLSLTEMTPAPGQGCLALEARHDHQDARVLAQAATDPQAHACLLAERAVVTTLGATCNTPVGAYARTAGEGLRLAAFVGLPDGSQWIRDTLEGDGREPAALGRALAERMSTVGARAMLATAEAQATAS